jgi:hypothetical protein
MVSIWLMKIKGAGESSKTKKIGFAGQSRFSENAIHFPRRPREGGDP